MKTLLILVTVLAAAASTTWPRPWPRWNQWSHSKKDSYHYNRPHHKSGAARELGPAPEVFKQSGSGPRGQGGETDAEWGYGPTNGPHTWAARFPMCRGPRQSPVALETRNAIVNIPFEPLQFNNYDVPTEMIVENIGVAVEVRAPNLRASITGGNLPDRYIFDMFHFHWGAVDSRGSEHTVDGRRYPGDIHLVHYRERYGNLSEAVKHEGGVVVISVMLEVSPYYNPALEPIVSRLSSIRNPEEEDDLPNFALEYILPKDTGHFFRYIGSLTTPECNEGAIWTLFKKPIHISSNQLQEFRQLVARDGSRLQDNFRNLQPLNGRQVCLAQLH